MTGPGQASIIYLDVDDEITSAASRIRAVGTHRVALVLPTGSRLATSRINFRLLAREAIGRERELAIVAPEAGTRTLAASAGLPVFATVSEFEQALASGTIGRARVATGLAHDIDDARPSVRGGSGARGTQLRGTDATRAFDAGTIVTQPRGRTNRESEPWPDPDEGRGRGRRWLAVLIALVLVFVIVSGVGAYVVLPTAIVTVRAVPEPVGPLSMEITADPLATSVDAEELVVPADIVTFDLEASDEFQATGIEVVDTAASGTLRWSNCDPTSAYTIRAGTRARTRDGVAFATTEQLFLPVAILSGGNPPSLTCQSREVRAEAVETGPSGNVAARTVTQVPNNLNSVVLRVTNPDAMTGGEHTETTIVTVEDVGAAQRTLAAALEAQFDEALTEPGRAPAGTTIVPETRTASEPQPVEDPIALIGQALDTFTLTYRATGTATAVREAEIVALADSLIRAEVAPDMSLVRGSVRIDVGEGRPDGAAVVYPVMASAQQVGSIDAESVREAIRGRSVGEARERLPNYGDATLEIWPDWVSAIPTLDFRLEVRVVADVPTEPATVPTPTVTPSRSSSPSPRRSASPAATRPASAVPSIAPSVAPSPSSS